MNELWLSCGPNGKISRGDYRLKFVLFLLPVVVYSF